MSNKRTYVAKAMFRDYCAKVGDRSRHADVDTAWTQLSTRDIWLIRADVAIRAAKEWDEQDAS